MAASGAAEIIPLFPLHTVLFPGAALALHIFEQRYRQLVQEGRDFGVVLIREGREVGSVPAVHSVGTLASFERVEALEDGRFDVLVRGGPRFRIVQLLEPAPYLLARVDWLEEPAGAAKVWEVGAWLEVEAPKRQRLLESGERALARAMLRDELERLRAMGRTAPMPPPGFNPN